MTQWKLGDDISGKSRIINGGIRMFLLRDNRTQRLEVS
jgi:hypothetical protein